MRHSRMFFSQAKPAEFLLPFTIFWRLHYQMPHEKSENNENLQVVLSEGQVEHRKQRKV